MKKSNFKKYEDDYAERESKELDRKKEHDYKELVLEKILLEEINKILEKNEIISREILDSLSHNLRTPIVTIKAYSDMMLSGKFGKPTPQQKEKLLRVQENTESLMEVILEMLEKSKKMK